MTGLNTNDLYADITSKNEFVQIDPTTGKITPIVTGLSSPHGLSFVAAAASTAPTAQSDLVPTFGLNSLTATGQSANSAGAANIDLLPGIPRSIGAMDPTPETAFSKIIDAVTHTHHV